MAWNPTSDADAISQNRFSPNNVSSDDAALPRNTVALTHYPRTDTKKC